MDEQTSSAYMLGEIKGLIAGIKEQMQDTNRRFDVLDTKLDKVDDRLRTVEKKAAVIGAVSGGVMSVGMALITEGIHQWLGRGGHP